MLVAIEGIDGCGKTAAAIMVKERIGAQFAQCDILHFPDRTTETGRVIDEMLRNGRARLEPYAFQSLQVVNRLEHLDKLIHASINPNALCLAVRYNGSGEVYGMLDGISPLWSRSVMRPLPVPDLDILLDVSADTAWTRMDARGLQPEAYEDKQRTLQVLAQYYRDAWDAFPRRSWCIDAERDLDEVVSKVCRFITQEMERRGTKLP